jgi:hypothetical protein
VAEVVQRAAGQSLFVPARAKRTLRPNQTSVWCDFADPARDVTLPARHAPLHWSPGQAAEYGGTGTLTNAPSILRGTNVLAASSAPAVDILVAVGGAMPQPIESGGEPKPCQAFLSIGQGWEQK